MFAVLSGGIVTVVFTLLLRGIIGAVTFAVPSVVAAGIIVLCVAVVCLILCEIVAMLLIVRGFNVVVIGF